MTINDAIFWLKLVKSDAERNGLTEQVDRYNHIIEWLRELAERREADSGNKFSIDDYTFTRCGI